MTTPAPTHCPECGAPQTPGDTCRDRYDRCLALELTDMRFGVVHNLTVPAYNLQHPSILSAAGWHYTRDLLGSFIDDAVTPEQARADQRQALDSGRRDWSFTKGPSLALPPGFAWSQTIPPVMATDPAGYGRAITNWARAVLRDSAAVAPL